MTFNQFLQRDGHFLLDGARIVDVTGNVKQFGSRVTGATKAGKPGATTTANGRGNGHSFNVGNRRWTSKNANISREWRL